MLNEFLRDPKEHDARGPHTVYVSQAIEASVTAEEQEGDTDVETALAGPGRGKRHRFGRNRGLRDTVGLQRVTTVAWRTTGETPLGGKPYRVEGRLNIKELISRTGCRLCREKGH